jgi:hypothetical protein
VHEHDNPKRSDAPLSCDEPNWIKTE